MIKYLSIFFLLALTLAFEGCEYSNQEELNPKTCDSTNTSYSLDIVPILKENCYRCHDNNNAVLFGESNFLEGYENVQTYAIGGLIIGNIKHLPNFKAMPKGAPKIPACDIAKIENWIRKGAPNN